MADYIIPEELREKDPNSDLDTLGAGFAFPLRITDSGSVKVTIGDDNVKSCILHIASYRKEDLYGCGSFGGRVPSLLFSVFSIDKLTMHEEWLQSAIENWETRCTQVRVTAGKSTDTTTDVKVVMLIQYSSTTTGESNYLNFEVEE